MTLVRKMMQVFGSSYAELILPVFLLASPAHALVYSEVDDSGITLETSQLLPTGTETVNGALDPEDGADIYRFAWGGGLFWADTFGSTFDTMLSIFDLSGNLLAFNDEAEKNELVSFISTELSAGNYLLGITYYNNNFEGNLSGYQNSWTVNWEGNGGYVMNLSALAPPAGVPEPGSMALLASGLLGLAFIRRWTAI
jgi:hypothetical protein